MENKGLFKAQRMSDGSEIIGYLLRSYPFTFIITEAGLDSVPIRGTNETTITVNATRVLEKSVKPFVESE